MRHECNTLRIKNYSNYTFILLFAGMTTTITTHPRVCPLQAEAGLVGVGEAMPIPQIIMDMMITMKITMATTIMTIVGAMKTHTMAMKMCTA